MQGDKASTRREDKHTPKASTVIKTILQCLFQLVIFIGIPYALLTNPQANSILTQTGLADPTFITYLTIFALVSVALIVIKNFSRPGTIINLVSGLALISSGIIFFLILGGTNSSQARLGYLTFFVPTQGSKIAVTIEFVSLALIWIGIAIFKATNLSLGFIEARRSKPSLKLPPPVQKIVAPAQAKP